MRSVSPVILAVAGVGLLALACSDSTSLNKSLAGNLNGDTTGNDTLLDKADTTAPFVTFAYPGGEGTQAGCEVDWRTPVVVAYSEPIDPVSVTPETFNVGAGMEGVLEVCGNVVWWKGKYAFDGAVAIGVVVSGEIKDLAGNPMGTDYTFLFCTEVEPGG